MSKSKTQTVFICQACGAQTAKWQGKCQNCEAWNSFKEEVVQKKSTTQSTAATRAVPLGEATHTSVKRWKTGFETFNTVLGGGVVPGSVVLLGGDPGIGKSTLMRQVVFALTQRVVYVSGEESIEQIKLQTDRLGLQSDQAWLLSENCVETLLQEVQTYQPHVVVIDSIQTLHSVDVEGSAGSVSQVRACTLHLVEYAKKHHVATFLIGHVNKAGLLAGPKVLEHMVDTVLQFEGERRSLYRVLRTQKNRFGSNLALGMYSMEQNGLKEVLSPSKALLSSVLPDESGNAIAVVLESNRPVLVEVQALVSVATYSSVQRLATGMDTKRLFILVALLESKAGLAFGKYDVFVNITGGLRVEDPAIDLALCMALVSALLNKPLPSKTVYSAEMGLNSELRPVPAIEARLKEAQNMHYDRLVCSAFGLQQKLAALCPKKRITEVIDTVLGASA